MKYNKNNKATILVKVLVGILVISLFTIITIVYFPKIKQRIIKSESPEEEVIEPEEEQVIEPKPLEEEKHPASVYCAANPGPSVLNGDIVYCDNNFVMWSITLSKTIPGVGNNSFVWAKSTEDEKLLPAYAKGDCNNLTDEDIVNYPACQACRNLDYAGFYGDWRLPTQSNGNLDANYCCDIDCGRNYVYCAPGRQLWDFGVTNCPNWRPYACTGDDPPSPTQGHCEPTNWDIKANAGVYWSATQHSKVNAWIVSFFTACAQPIAKGDFQYVRCVLGQ